MQATAQFQAAQRAYENLAPVEPDRDEEAFTEAFIADPQNVRKAAEWVDGSLDASTYTELSVALYDLHATDPDKLAGTTTLAALYRVAKQYHAAIRAQLEIDADNAWAKECERLERAA